MKVETLISPGEARLARALEREGLFLKYLIGFSAAGIFLCGALLYLEAAMADSVAPQFCTISAWLSCDKVLRSSYSKLFGIPLSAIGLAGFSIFLSLSSLRFFYPDKPFALKAPMLLLIVSSGAMLFEIYLNAVELFAIRAFCPLCLVVLALILAIFISSVGLMKSAAVVDASFSLRAAAR